MTHRYCLKTLSELGTTIGSRISLDDTCLRSHLRTSLRSAPGSTSGAAVVAQLALAFGTRL